MRRLIVVACLAALITAAASQSASALVAGIGDQNASTFTDPNFKALKVKRTRLSGLTSGWLRRRPPG
jgi:hypothetical protein